MGLRPPTGGLLTGTERVASRMPVQGVTVKRDSRRRGHLWRAMTTTRLWKSVLTLPRGCSRATPTRQRTGRSRLSKPDLWAQIGHMRTYLANAYRVLLTRARQGMVVFVPFGSPAHPASLNRSIRLLDQPGNVPTLGDILETGEVEKTN